MSDMPFTAPGNTPGTVFTPPSLPKGGGTITGSSGALSAGGPDGLAGWSIPLPVSSGRGFSPGPALSYSSASGNSEYGLGWQLTVPSIRRDTRFGVPTYKDIGSVNGPDGDELICPAAPEIRTALPFSELTGSYRVTRYLSRYSGAAGRTEYWEELKDGQVIRVFWIDFSPDGSLALFGWSDSARLADPEDDTRIAEWKLEEQVTARGEHILWRWRTENDDSCSEAEKSQHPRVAGCYLSHIHWANVTPGLFFFVPENSRALADNNWLCSLVFDYGERNTPTDLPPPYTPDAIPANARSLWPVRSDIFSRWHYGFEVRTRRLCREFLLFHRTALMAGENDDTPELVSRLRLTHETSPVVSWLTSAQVFAYETDGDNASVTLPPVEFGLSQPQPLPDSNADWEYRADLEGFSWQYWQMADLTGEGLPGILYQDSGGWWYRAPQRDTSDGAGPDAVTWGAAQKLERIPSLTGWQLMDLDNDGHIEQVVSLPGVTGSFTLDPNGDWKSFIPFSALPAEFTHPHAQLADLTGNGLSDLIMVGPRAVRVWPSDGKRGWKQAVSQVYQGTWPLPVGDDGQRLVLFADLPGSGQQHLTEITAGSVRYWPSLGHGRFGEAVSIGGFSVPAESFSPGRVFLADTDGSGTPDIVYLMRDGLRLFINESGNNFREAKTIPLPEGIRGDGLCTLQVADVQGLGVASIMLTVPHTQPGLSPRTWLLDLNLKKPWLLDEICENTGSRTLLSYRSSAQAWLDEKKERQAAGDTPVSYLPFPVHTVSLVTQVNDITGLILGSETRYIGGVWDAKEREFAGFRQVIQRDTHAFTRGTTEELAPPAEVRSWFMTGLREHDEDFHNAFTAIDEYPQRPVRFVRQTLGESAQAFVPDEETEYWLRKSLRGALKRTEVYGLDGTSKSTVPYSVNTVRWQISALTDGSIAKPASLRTEVENITYSCERYYQDPVITQTIVLQQDSYGAVLESASVSYPRRLSAQALLAEENSRNIYPASLPEGLIRESTDTQQYDCWIKLTRACVHNLDSETDFVTGLPDTVRTDVIWYGNTHPEGNPEERQNHSIPQEGFSAEFLLDITNGEREIDRLLACPGSVVLDSFIRTHWRSAEDGQSVADVPDRQALLAFTETAMHDEQSLNVLRPLFEETLRDLAISALSDTCAQDSDPVLCRLRRRLPKMPAAALAREAIRYLQQVPDDSDALKVIRAALKKAVSVNGLSQRLLEMKNESLPEPLRLQLKKESRIPDAWLPLVAGWFMHDADTNNMLPPLAVSAAEKETFTGALALSIPDTLFWRMVITEADGDVFTDAHQLLSQKMQAESLESLLRRGGYHPVTVPHTPAVNEAWSGRHNHFTYQGASGFWLPDTFRESDLVRATTLRYTDHCLAVREATDDISHFTSVERFDWRFIAPVRIKDINDNIKEARLDALGRLLWARFYGTETPPGAEEAVQAGYSPFADIVFTPPLTAEDAVALNETKGVPVHEAFTVVTDSWMRQMPDAQGKPSGIRCGELAWRRQAEQLSRDGIALNESDDPRTPPHIIRIQTDRYDDDPEQQVRVQVMLYGGGQILQTAMLNPPGDALVRTAAGGLKVDERGVAVSEHATVRWAVTGKTEYDNKGQPVRVWLPFYLNDWRWVSDDSARDGIYADTHVRDATGRECRIIRAAGEDVDGIWANYECRTHWYPWFTVSEDENDTWLEVTEAARRRTLH